MRETERSPHRGCGRLKRFTAGEEQAGWREGRVTLGGCGEGSLSALGRARGSGCL